MTFELTAARIAGIQANFDAAEIKLTRLQAKPFNVRRSARIEAIENKQTARLERIAALTDSLPKDEFTPSFLVDPVTGKNVGVSVTIIDSPYDNTYVGGTPIAISLSGRYCETGTSGFRHTTGTWDGIINDTEIISVGSNRLTGDYSASVSLLDAGTRESFYSQELINSDGLQLI